jgi:hypothetical protein
MSQHHDISPRKGVFDSIRKPDSICMIQITGRTNNHPDRPTRMQRPVILTDDFLQGNDLRSFRENQIRVLMNSFSHCLLNTHHG